MKFSSSIFILIVLVLIAGCNKNSDPVSAEIPIRNEPDCFFSDFELIFEDTCSLNFAKSFIQTNDSISIKHIFYGYKFTVKVDSGDQTYWTNYFNADQTIESVEFKNDQTYNLNLIWKNSIEYEKARIDSLENVTVINSQEYKKRISLNIPKDSEFRLEEKFKDLNFIHEVLVIYVCNCW